MLVGGEGDRRGLLVEQGGILFVEGGGMEVDVVREIKFFVSTMCVLRVLQGVGRG